MSSQFLGRLAQSARLETPFIAAFNELCRTYRIYKFGIESTELRNLHEYIRHSMDVTSHFIRYLPDSALVQTDREGVTSPPTTLLEFKLHDTLVQQDSFFARVQAEHRRRNQNNPPLQSKQDLFAVEQASLDMYQRLTRIGVKVVVVGWQTKRTEDSDSFRAQYADKVVTCQVQDPSRIRRVKGSGTEKANVHYGAFVPLREFFERELLIAPETTDAVIRAVIAP